VYVVHLTQDELYLDMFLYRHVDELYSQIIDRAMLQYCSPFVSLDMNQMAQVFVCNVHELEAQLAQLISTNQLDARIDSQNKSLRTNDTNIRQKVYKNAVDVGEKYLLEARLNTIRTKLTLANLVVK
jgi:COP9 signalosome complex subunit 1